MGAFSSASSPLAVHCASQRAPMHVRPACRLSGYHKRSSVSTAPTTCASVHLTRLVPPLRKACCGSLHRATPAALRVDVAARTSDSSGSSVGTAVRSNGDSGGTRAYSAAAPRTAAKQRWRQQSRPRMDMRCVSEPAALHAIRNAVAKAEDQRAGAANFGGCKRHDTSARWQALVVRLAEVGNEHLPLTSPRRGTARVGHAAASLPAVHRQL